MLLSTKSEILPPFSIVSFFSLGTPGIEWLIFSKLIIYELYLATRAFIFILLITEKKSRDQNTSVLYNSVGYFNTAGVLTKPKFDIKSNVYVWKSGL